MEIWLKNVDPGGRYLVSIDVGCSAYGPNPAFKIGASDAAGGLVDAEPPDQVLLAIIEPHTNLSLVTVKPHQLDSWIFHLVEVFRLP